jgi:oligopeptide transport system permease protein
MLVIITVAFFMMRAAPGNPYSVDRKLPPQVEANMRASLGLDKPLHEQYFEYLGNVVTGDLGPSMRNKDKTVAELIGEGLPVSLTIGALAMVLAIFFGVGLGVIAAVRQNKAADYSTMGLAMIGISIPTFVTGPLLSLIFGVWLGWFVAAGLDLGRMNFYNLTLPVLTLALPQIAIISRLMRASMIETLRSNSIRTARAKGLSERRILLRHAAPAGEPRDRSPGDADHKADDGGDGADHQRDAETGHDARDHVAAVDVGAEDVQVFEGRREREAVVVLRLVFVRPDEGAEDCDEDQEGKHDKAGHGRLVGKQAPAGIVPQRAALDRCAIEQGGVFGRGGQHGHS